MTTMKAIRIHSYGGPEVLVYEDAPIPDPGSGEVLIRVRAAGVNPIDWKIRAGYMSAFLNLAFPFILGIDVAGEVESVGSDVTDFKPGDPVYAWADFSRNGSYAEYVTVAAANVAPKPESLSFVEAAAVPQAGLTAWQALFETGGLQPGQTVFIHAAAGGVGTFAVQLAKWHGARVYGTASNGNLEFLRDIGVDEPLDYATLNSADIAQSVDLVVDAVGGETLDRSWTILKPGGMLVGMVAPPSEETANTHGVRSAFHMTHGSGQQLREIAAMIDAGHVRPVVQTVLPLAETRRAHEMSQTGRGRGKIILEV
ncbi:MAG: NADP-dependent oxidoreductase [Anaerolineae bacterium]